MRNNRMNRWMRVRSVLVLLVCGWLLINTARAGCTNNYDVRVPVSTMTFNIPSFGISTENPVGDWWQVSAQLITNCTEQIYGLTAFGYISSSGLTYSDGGVVYNIYNTGTPGIGFIAAISDSFSGVFYPMPIDHVATTPYTGNPYGTSVSVTVKVKFITTAALTPGVYSIPALTLMGVNGASSNQTGVNGQGLAVTNPFNINVIANSCSVDVGSQNQSVTLDDVTGNDLPAVGSTAKDKTFNVLLNCQPQVAIYVLLNGTPNPDTGADGVLQVSNAGMAGTSRGIGIQILNNDIPLPIGANIPTRYTSGGQENIPFTARYYRTLTDVTAGTANTIATLNVNYR
ncbi:Type-1A pilin [Serratia fonticola]|nr:Type-1A pilin [Serratia fonticola]CAI1873952.1 Type-1A pilin [Serratia fonticola]CAI1926081.1 Type-1A pilin [Serratia fonticola]